MSQSLQSHEKEEGEGEEWGGDAPHNNGPGGRAIDWVGDLSSPVQREVVKHRAAEGANVHAEGAPRLERAAVGDGQQHRPVVHRHRVSADLAAEGQVVPLANGKPAAGEASAARTLARPLSRAKRATAGATHHTHVMFRVVAMVVKTPPEARTIEMPVVRSSMR